MGEPPEGASQSGGGWVGGWFSHQAQQQTGDGLIFINNLKNIKDMGTIEK